MAKQTHDALVIVAARQPYEIHNFPTIPPEGDEILVHVRWTASTPLDLHQADGGLLLVEPPLRTGSTGAGVVVAIGPDVQHFKVGDRVFGFAHQHPKWKTHQEYSTSPEWVWGKVPDSFTLEQAVTLPENFVTAFNTLWADLRIPTPWPRPSGYAPARASERILVWGAASSVGQLLLEVLRYYGYHNLVAVASSRHHEYLRSLGAAECFDYNNPNIVQDLLKTRAEPGQPVFPMIVDCIGSQSGSLEPISKVAQSDSRVAVMLPVILKHATEAEAPEYSMDAAASAQWQAGVTVRGVRTHFYWKNDTFREKLQTEIMAGMLAGGHVRPNRYRIIEGRTLQERATTALSEMRQGVSGEKLIWRVAEE
ncbi:GroES-like protein [Xylariomycetidae sp. FL2044]|nr:GroES-like protein [Xylariomycetidae sp. FL2044]